MNVFSRERKRERDRNDAKRMVKGLKYFVGPKRSMLWRLCLFKAFLHWIKNDNFKETSCLKHEISLLKKKYETV